MPANQAHIKLNLIQLQSRITNYSYFSKDCLPSHIDTLIFEILQKNSQVPKKDDFPNLFHWFVTIKQFHPRARNSWNVGDKRLYQSDSVFCSIFEAIQQENQKTIKSEEGRHYQNEQKKVCSVQTESSEVSVEQKQFLVSGYDGKSSRDYCRTKMLKNKNN